MKIQIYETFFKKLKKLIGKINLAIIYEFN